MLRWSLGVGVILLVSSQYNGICASSSISYNKCDLSDLASYDVPQYVIYENRNLPLNILTSNRISHRIISHITHILLTEALGYKNVSILSVNTSSEKSNELSDYILRIAKLLGSEKKSSPDFMVDLEVWLPPGLSLSTFNDSYNVSSVGALGPVVQYGWFLCNATVNKYWKNNNKLIDHWRYFSNKKDVRAFMSTSGLSFGQLRIPDGILPTSSLINITRKLIKTRDLAVKLLDKSTVPITDCSKEDKRMLLTWYPSTITSAVSMQRISFSRPCTLNFDRDGKVIPIQNESPCDPYPLYQLTKWTWSELRTAAPIAYKFLRKISVTQRQYEDILKNVSVSLKDKPPPTDEFYRKVACKWLRDTKNVKTWRPWIPKLPKKVRMVIGGMFPKEGGRWYEKSLLISARAAVKDVNENILKDQKYELYMDEHNVSCDRQDEALFEYNQIVLDKCGKRKGYLLGILAASCSDSIEPMILLSQHYRTVIISPTVESRKYSKEEKYKYFFRTVPDMRNYATHLGDAFKQLNWKRAALFRKDDHFVNKNEFSHSSINIVDDYETAEEQLKFDDVMANLKKARDESSARIFVVEYFEQGTSIVLCAATKLKMQAKFGYVWFLNPWLRDNFIKDIEEFYKQPKHGGCKLEDMLETVQIYFVLHHRRKSGESESSGSDIQGQYYPFVTDAVTAFAQGLKALAGNDTILLSRLNEEDVSQKWLKTLRVTKFGKGSDRWKFGEGNDSATTLWYLIQHQCKVSAELESPCSSSFVGKWEKLDKSRTKFQNMGDGIKWIDGKVPTDGSREEDNCFWPDLSRKTGSCTIAVIIVVIIVLVSVFVIGILFIIILRPQYKQLKEAKRQLAPFSDILADLAPLEMKPFQIVLNLPLGEGAFGTVRGGEAKLNGQWHAVAVKTLHERATQEEKMEFLSEARIMKAFNHPNIVKLLGVRAQSKSEPYMTVMEFMLYGDMKKYLIARHVLAKEEPNHTDICPTTLTAMTIDVVSGLEYLHGLSYIHRDLALRNCLVGQNRQVKLCDFGLTREVNDRRDYYRFERRGMLPVRWMAPESLHSGVFTIKSDIWSFGVVLYEIVTFGNKPYRDKRNEDVIDCMRVGNDCLIRYLNNPEERLPKLLTLMRECFHFHPHERPNAPTILSYLRQDPGCVRPCLEEAPPDPGELPAGLLGPESGDRRRGGSGGGAATSAATDRIRFHSGPRGSTSTSTAAGVGFISDSVFDTALTQHAGLNSSFPPSAGGLNGAGPITMPTVPPLPPGSSPGTNYATSTEFIPMRPTRSLNDGLGGGSGGDEADNAGPTTGLLETEISIGSDVDVLAACDYDVGVTFSPFANGATPHSRASMGLGSSHGSLHSRLTHAS